MIPNMIHIKKISDILTTVYEIQDTDIAFLKFAGDMLGILGSVGESSLSFLEVHIQGQ